MIPPRITGIRGGDMVLKFFTGWDRSSMIGFVDAEDHAQYPAGNPRQHSAQADDYALQDADQEKTSILRVGFVSDA